MAVSMNGKDLRRRATLKFIKIARAAFFNTWVHQLPITNYIYKKVFGSLYRNQPEDIVAFQGHRFHIKTHDITILPSMLNGTYETSELDLYRGLLRPGMRVVDVGANMGMYSVIGSAAVGPTGSVVAFEPEATNFDLLGRNLAENGCANVKPVQAGVGAKAGTTKLYLQDDSIGTHSIGQIGDRWTEIAIVTLDDELLGGPKVDFIKMDIEGYEEAALEGMRGLLERDRPILLMEFAPSALVRCGSSPPAFLDSLRSRFTHMYWVHGSHDLVQIDDQSFSALRAKDFGTFNLLLASEPLRPKVV